jgi:LysM repeat protein
MGGEKGGPASDPVVTPAKETVVAPAEKPAPKTEIATASTPGYHRVKPGETLYSIARDHSCSVPELKKLNKLESENIQPGTDLKLPGAPANAKANTGYADSERPNTHNGGSSLIEMIAKVSPDGDAEKAKQGDEFPELEILKAAPGTRIAPEAKQTKFTEKYSGKPFLKVEEQGSAAPIEDLGTDQTKFYAFHKYLPKGSYIRVDYPDRDQSILVEVVNQLPANDANIIRLSAKSRDYLMMRDPSAKVVLRYVMPVE